MSRLKRYWCNLSARDQQILSIGGFTILCILLYAMAWAPLQDKLKRLRPQVISQSADLAWMQQQAAMIRKLSQFTIAKKGENKQPLLTLVDQIAKTQKIRDRIKQIQPGKESGTAKIWFDKVLFEDWLLWMDKVVERGAGITRVSVTKSADFPRVNIRLELAQK